MKTRISEVSRYTVALALVAAAGLVSVSTSLPLVGSQAWATAAFDDANNAAQAETEDVLYLADGRVLRGNILEEDRISIRFEYVDRKLGLSTPLTIFKSDILRIQRDVPIVAQPEEVEEGSGTRTPTKVATGYDENLPGIYVIPIKGEMARDVLHDVYDPVIEDAKAHDPECIVFLLDCDEREYREPDSEGPTEDLDFEEYRELVHKLKKAFGDTRQVVWVKDAIGVSSVIALSWNEIYMHSEARLDGLGFIGDMTSERRFSDEHVREKMKAAWSGVVKGFMELGNHDLDLGQAMMFPEEKLSGTFQGLKVLWSLDENGDYVVDNMDKQTAGFDAEAARNLRISQETVDTLGDDGLADLAFILGYREYYKIPGEAEEIVNSYVDDWRQSFTDTEEWWKDYAQYMGWAQGEDALKFMGRSLDVLNKILAAMNRYRAVEKEWAERGRSKLDVELQIKQLQEQIRALKEAERRNRDSGRGRGGGYGGGGGLRPGG